MAKAAQLLVLVILLVLWLYYQNSIQEFTEEKVEEAIKLEEEIEAVKDGDEIRTGRGAINEARKKVFETDIRNLEIALTNQYYEEMLNQDLVGDLIYVFEDGENTTQNKLPNLRIPESGIAVVRNNGQIGIAVEDGYWCAVKGFEDNQTEIFLFDKECNHPDFENYNY